MNNNLTFVIAVRKGSQRIKNKNIRKFANTSLLKIKLDQIRKCFKKSKILFSSDCMKSIKIAKEYNCNINLRPKKFCSNHIPMKKVYKYLASLVTTKYVCYLHVTSPLLKNETLKKALKTFYKNKKIFKALATVNEVREYLWYKGKSLNYDSDNHPRSQSLPVYYALNFAINIIETKLMYKESRIVGRKFFPFVLKFPENIDVDEPWQFKNAENLYKKIFIKNK